MTSLRQVFDKYVFAKTVVPSDPNRSHIMKDDSSRGRLVNYGLLVIHLIQLLCVGLLYWNL